MFVTNQKYDAGSDINYSLDTGTIGPVTTMPSFQATFGELSPTLHGIVVSAALLPGALTALITGVLADRYGRTRMIAMGSLIYGIGATLETASMWLAMFIVGRLFKGIGEGLFLSTVYVHVCEISPARIRGVMASVPQFFISSGLVIGYFVCYGTSHLPGSISWRLPIVLQAGIAFTNSAAAIFLPQSPRWLQARGCSEEAHRVVEQLGLDEAEKLELQSHFTVVLSQSPDLSFWESVRQTAHDLKEAFDAPFRSRTLFGCFLMASQQLSGIDGILYYAPILLQAAGISSLQASFLASGVSAVVILVVTVPGSLFADAWGRKTSTLVGGASIFMLWIISASLYAAGEVHADKGAARWVVIVSIYLYAAIFSVTWAIGLRTFMIESLPNSMYPPPGHRNRLLQLLSRSLNLNNLAYVRIIT